MIPEQSGTGLWASIGAAITGLLGGAIWMRTKLSRDSAAIASDRAEVGMLDRLQRENEELREALTKAYQDRNTLALQFADVSGSLRAMEGKTAHLEQTVEELKQEVGRLTALLVKGAALRAAAAP